MTDSGDLLEHPWVIVDGGSDSIGNDKNNHLPLFEISIVDTKESLEHGKKFTVRGPREGPGIATEKMYPVYCVSFENGV